MKTTSAQIQAAQAKADRRAEAIARRGDVALAADNARVREMYEKAAPVKVASQGVTIYLLDELDQIENAEVRNRAYQLAALWPAAVPGVAFPGVIYAPDQMNRNEDGNWYVNGFELPGDLPAMCRNNGGLTQEFGTDGYVQVGHKGYRYSTVTVRTALGRIKRGKALFNLGA